MTMREEGNESLGAREPRRQLRLNLPPEDPVPVQNFEVVALPQDPEPSREACRALIRQLLVDEGNLVLPNRAASPREIVQFLELSLQTLLDFDSVRLLPVDFPPGEFWRDVEPTSLPLPEEKLRQLVASKNVAFYVPDFSKLEAGRGSGARPGSGLYIGIGDNMAGWQAVIEARDTRRKALTDERLGIAALMARHFQTQLTSAVRLQSMIFFDYLTGLYNRSYFEDQLERQITVARRRKQGLALCIIDIDDFKSFNTRYGYEGGDQVLTTVGSMLKSAVRATDTLARYGGEEFAVLLAPPVLRDEARVIAERLRIAVDSQPAQVQSLEGDFVSARVTVSLGVALLPDNGYSAHEIWNAANRMLLVAKRLGKNQVRFAEELPGGEETRA